MSKRFDKNALDYYVLKDSKNHYGVFKDNIDEETFDAIIVEQRDKPTYLPNSFEDFLKFSDLNYFDKNESIHREKLANFFSKQTKSGSSSAYIFAGIVMMFMRTEKFQEIFKHLEDMHLLPDNENDLQELLTLISNAYNNTRMPSNNGFTPIELRNLHGPINPNNVQLSIGPNIRNQLINGDLNIYELYKEIDENNEMPLMMKESLKSQLKEIINEMVNIPKA